MNVINSFMKNLYDSYSLVGLLKENDKKSISKSLERNNFKLESQVNKFIKYIFENNKNFEKIIENDSTRNEIMKILIKILKYQNNPIFNTFSEPIKNGILNMIFSMISWIIFINGLEVNFLDLDNLNLKILIPYYINKDNKNSNIEYLFNWLKNEAKIDLVGIYDNKTLYDWKNIFGKNIISTSSILKMKDILSENYPEKKDYIDYFIGTLFFSRATFYSYKVIKPKINDDILDSILFFICSTLNILLKEDFELSKLTINSSKIKEIFNKMRYNNLPLNNYYLDNNLQNKYIRDLIDDIPQYKFLKNLYETLCNSNLEKSKQLYQNNLNKFDKKVNSTIEVAIYHLFIYKLLITCDKNKDYKYIDKIKKEINYKLNIKYNAGDYIYFKDENIDNIYSLFKILIFSNKIFLDKYYLKWFYENVENSNDYKLEIVLLHNSNINIIESLN